MNDLKDSYGQEWVGEEAGVMWVNSDSVRRGEVVGLAERKAKP